MLKALDLWLPAYLRRKREPSAAGKVHAMICVCDHFEPFHDADKTEAFARVEKWKTEFPKIASAFRDANGAPPKHTFFYPVEQYDADIVERIAQLCRETQCETEVHLHHDRDTAENLRATLERGKSDLLRHGLLTRDESGATRFGFIHGNWALDDSHPDGRHCGVREELRVLREAGCYADFTMPSAPDRTQTRTINSVYYATDTPAAKSHDTGIPAKLRSEPCGDLLLVQGPLGLNWSWRKFGILPRVENGDLTAANPPTIDRLKLWIELQIHVLRRPQWLFIKLHTHGALPRNSAMLLGEPMWKFHGELAEVSLKNSNLVFHYVTAREMVNIIHAAEAGHSGDPGEFRDFRYRSLILR